MPAVASPASAQLTSERLQCSRTWSRSRCSLGRRQEPARDPDLLPGEHQDRNLCVHLFQSVFPHRAVSCAGHTEPLISETADALLGRARAGIREYGAIPLLTHFHLNPSPLPPRAGTSASVPPPVPSPHLHNLLPTAISGLIAGSNFSYFQRPPATPFATHARAGITLALGCTVLQGIVNELDVVRIRLLMWGEERRQIKRLEAGMTLPGGEEPLRGSASLSARPANSPVSAPAPPSPTSSASASSSPAPPMSVPRSASPLSDLTDVNPRDPSSFSDPGRETFSERSDRLASSGWRWFTDKLSVLAPLKRIDDREYERRLEELLQARTNEREKVRGEIAQLEVVKKRLEQRQRDTDESVSRA